jgi:glucan 1,3-beta-glucosidase
MGSGSTFGLQASPKVVVQVGDLGSSGRTEISGIIFSTRGPGMCKLSIKLPRVLNRA